MKFKTYNQLIKKEVFSMSYYGFIVGIKLSKGNYLPKRIV